MFGKVPGLSVCAISFLGLVPPDMCAGSCHCCCHMAVAVITAIPAMLPVVAMHRFVARSVAALQH
jgi:hypothetical protein